MLVVQRQRWGEGGKKSIAERKRKSRGTNSKREEEEEEQVQVSNQDKKKDRKKVRKKDSMCQRETGWIIARTRQKLWASWHHNVNSWAEQPTAGSCHWPKMKAMWLGVECSTGVNFREPTPACRKAWRQSPFTRACLNLRGETRKWGSRSTDRSAG